MKQLRSS